jgi:hypothetical protein
VVIISVVIMSVVISSVIISVVIVSVTEAVDMSVVISVAGLVDSLVGAGVVTESAVLPCTVVVSV